MSEAQETENDEIIDGLIEDIKLPTVPRTNYEYCVGYVIYDIQDTSTHDEDILTRLNQYGRHGWRYVEMDRNDWLGSNQTTRIWFEREVISDESGAD